jgi:hypothetical protein
MTSPKQVKIVAEVYRTRIIYNDYDESKYNVSYKSSTNTFEIFDLKGNKRHDIIFPSWLRQNEFASVEYNDLVFVMWRRFGEDDAVKAEIELSKGQFIE